MTERTLNELANAEIVPDMGGPNAWFVRFGEGEYDTVGKSAKAQLVLEDGVLVPDTENVFTYGDVVTTVDLPNDVITLERDGDAVVVPSSKEEHVLWSIHDKDGDRLNKLFDELYVPTVRQGLMDMLMPRFRKHESDIRKTEDGWLVGGDILVSWDASNHPVNVVQTHVVRNGSTVEADEDKEARDIQFHIPDDTEVMLPNGTTTDLDEVEIKFLTSVALCLGRDVNRMYDDGLVEAIENSTVTAFTDTKSGLHHGHGIQKHTLSMLGVTEDAANRLWYNDYDHAGVWELAARSHEFKNAPIDVFEDAPNNDPDKWRKIQSTKEKAPIPKHIRSDIESRYYQ